jgi:hypothetical protein
MSRKVSVCAGLLIITLTAKIIPAISKRTITTPSMIHVVGILSPGGAASMGEDVSLPEGTASTGEDVSFDGVIGSISLINKL